MAPVSGGVEKDDGGAADLPIVGVSNERRNDVGVLVLCDASDQPSDRAQFVNRSAQEHLMYIQEKVNPVLEDRKSELLAILGIEDGEDSSVAGGLDLKSERSTKANDESEEEEEDEVHRRRAAVAAGSALKWGVPLAA
eukprot:Skav208890  [mRNA]  locus=scaffold270:387285:401929:- [translate_table: standard]